MRQAPARQICTRWWLDRAYEKHDPGVMAIIDNPFTRELRSDLRFCCLLQEGRPAFTTVMIGADRYCAINVADK